MLIEKCGNGPPRRLVNVQDLGEEFVSRIQRLADIVYRIVAVFSYEHHSIHGQ